MKLLLVILFLLLVFTFHVSVIYSENPEWINYTCGKDVGDLAVEGRSEKVGVNGTTMTKQWSKILM